MTRVLIYSPSFASQRDSSPALVVAVRSPAIPPTHCVPAHVPSSLSRLSSGTAKGTSGCARRHGGALLRLRRPSGLGSSRCAGTLQESAPWHLGAAIPRVRSG